MKKYLIMLILPLALIFTIGCEDDDVDSCNDAVDSHTVALAQFEDIQALALLEGFEGQESYVTLCELLSDLAEAGLADCPESFATYADWSAEDFDDFKAACSNYGPE